MNEDEKKIVEVVGLQSNKKNLDELSWKQLMIKAYKIQLMLVCGFLLVFFTFMGVFFYKLLENL